MAKTNRGGRVSSTLVAAMASSCIWSCFVGGTTVATPRGPRRIDQLAVGDEVWSWSVARRALVVGRVSAVMASEVDRLFRVEAGELVVEGVTENHPFFDPTTGQWRPVRELQRGSPLLGWLGRGEARAVEVTAVAERAERATVYDLTIEGEHDFFAEGLLVHNKSVDGPETSCHTGCDTAVAAREEPSLAPVTLARCELAVLTIDGVGRPVEQVRVFGPSSVAVLTQEQRDDQLLVTVEVGAQSAEGVNDVLVDWADGADHTLEDVVTVRGDDC